MLTTQHLLLVLAVLPLTEALLGNPIDWDDFSNNFGTDIAPLLSLFGENPTKQFLSESTSFWDSVLFGIAPLGIITTVVSVIRIYGNSSWKSFIGRAQEPHGLAEAELCSSTSDDVCELWSNGGICRVFGRPKMLAFIFTRPETSNAADFYCSAPAENGKHDFPVCGIETPKDLLCNIGARRGEEEMEDRKWEQTAPTASRSGMDDQTFENHFAPYPNLSLTIGIRHRLPMWVAVPIGVMLQFLFFGLTIWFTYFVPEFYDPEEGQKPVHWAFGLTIGGTIGLSLGMTLCARLIDKKSCERHFKRKSGSGKVYWLQPGGQRVGDQLFNAFAYCNSGKDGVVKYITSWPVNSHEAASPWTYYLAVVVSMLGWIVQFIGLRLVPGTVSLSLFGITVFMSLVRAGLRSSRLPGTANLLQSFERDVVEDHELDWQALELVLNEDDRPKDQGHNYHKCWHIIEEYDLSDRLQISKLCTTGRADGACEWMRKREACKSSKGLPNGAAQALRFRSRLAYLTSEQAQPADQAWSTEIREMAAILQKALESAADYIFSNFPLLADSQDLTEFAWSAKCKTPCGQNGRHKAHNVCFHMRKDDGAWSMDRNQLEAALGLWSWSLRQNFKSPRQDKKFGDGGYMKKSIVVADGDESSWRAVVNLWVTQTKLQPPSRVNSTATLLSIPTETHVFLEKSQSLARGSAIEKHEANNSVPCSTLAAPASTLKSTSLRLFFRSRNSRLQLLAQDLFTIFINRVANIIGPLKEVAYNEPHSTDIIGLRQTHFSGLSNPHIESVIKVLVDTCVASREEALMSVVPALAQQEKLPSIEAVTEALFWKAKTFRREGKLVQSENLLNGLFFLGPKGYRNQALRYLGEVYRAEMRLENPHPRDNDVDVDPAPAAVQLGLVQKKLSSLKEKVESMKKKVGIMETGSSASAEDLKAARETSQCYEYVLQCYERRVTGIKFPTPKRNQTPVESLLGDAGLDKAQKRQISLTLKDEGELSAFDESQLLKLLRLAIDEDIPELIEDLWSVGQELIHKKVDAELKIGKHASKTGGTPLWWAIDSNSSPDVMSALVDWPGLRLERADGYGITVLGRAVQMENEEATRLLLRKGANCNKKASRDGDGSSAYPVVTAAENGNLEILVQLLTFGAATDDSVMPDALRKAVTESKVEATEVLLRYIHDLNDTQNSGYHKAAHRLTQDVVPQAALGQNIAMVKCLMRYGANITEKFRISYREIGPYLKRNLKTLNKDYVPSLDPHEIWTTALALHCTMHETNLEFVQHLVKSGVDVNMEVDGGNALIFAVLADNVEIVEYLLERGAEPTRPVSTLPDFGNALVAACGKNEGGGFSQDCARPRRREILELLLSKCSPAHINVEVQHGFFENALIAAIRRAESWVVDGLLRKGANVSARVNRGHYGNALITAAHLHRVDCLESMILSRPGCVTETLDDGCGEFRTALDAAEARCLEQARADIMTLKSSGCFDKAATLPVIDYGYGGHRRGNVAAKFLENWAAFERSDVADVADVQHLVREAMALVAAAVREHYAVGYDEAWVSYCVEVVKACLSEGEPKSSSDNFDGVALMPKKGDKGVLVLLGKWIRRGHAPLLSRRQSSLNTVKTMKLLEGLKNHQ